MKLIFAVCLVVAGLLSAPGARAEIVSLEEAVKPIVVGKADAPVTIIEYSSLGCSHCANFHRDAYPKLKRNYLDTGKARMVFVDFPLGTTALAAAMIARCSGPARYLGFVDLYFRSQAQWSRADNPLAALKKIARLGGLSGDDVDRCLRQQALVDFLQGTAREASAKHEINSTPSFLINGRKIAGALPYDDFSAVVDEALAKAK